jgi:hypothetical protein
MNDAGAAREADGLDVAFATREMLDESFGQHGRSSVVGA